MSKELKEQWRNGTLRGCFYWKLPNGNICTAYTDTMRDIKNVRDSDEVEVLQETPSYVEYNELVQKMHILEKQLNEAEEVIRIYFKNTQNAAYKSLGMNDGYYKKAFIYATAKEYLEKWGVK